MPSFIHPDFARHSFRPPPLPHTYAEDQPILDYHNHLPPQDLDINDSCEFIDAWLEETTTSGAMRANGVAEKYCTGRDVSPREVQAWLRPCPHPPQPAVPLDTSRTRPLFFGIEDFLDETTAESISERHDRCSPPKISASASSKFKVQRSARPTIPSTTSVSTSTSATRRSKPKSSPPSAPTKRYASMTLSRGTPGWIASPPPATPTCATSPRCSTR